jgi:hypothetical protein
MAREQSHKIYFFPLFAAFFLFSCSLSSVPAGDPAMYPEGRGAYSGFSRSLHASTPYGYRIAEAPQPVRAGKYSERFELHSGDCSGNEDWDDCKEDRERSELKQLDPLAENDVSQWYAWSIYLPEGYPNIFPVKVALAQFHQGLGHPPLMFQNGEGGYWIEMNQLHLPPVLLIPDSDLRGKWHDLLMHVNWTTRKSGYLTLWVDGKKKFDRRGATLKKAGEVYFKYGIYRSFLSRAPKGKAIPNQVVYFDEVKWGHSRAEVEPARKP